MSLEDDLIRSRTERIRDIEALGFKAYGHRFDFSHTIPEIISASDALVPAGDSGALAHAIRST